VGRLIETVLILLAMLSLWPWILGHRREPWSRLLLAAALVAMVVVAIRRVNRIRRVR